MSASLLNCTPGSGDTATDTTTDTTVTDTTTTGPERLPYDEPQQIAVIGGHGGAGASILAAALAVTSAPRYRTFLVDVDHLGGGIDVLFGYSEGATWIAFGDPPAARSTPLAPEALRREVHSCGRLAILPHPRGIPSPVTGREFRRVLDPVLAAGERLVVDVPRYRAPGSAAAEAVSRADLTVMVTRADLRSVTTAATLADSLRTRTPRLVIAARSSGQDLDPATIAGILATRTVHPYDGSPFRRRRHRHRRPAGGHRRRTTGTGRPADPRRTRRRGMNPHTRRPGRRTEGTGP